MLLPNPDLLISVTYSTPTVVYTNSVTAEMGDFHQLCLFRQLRCGSAHPLCVLLAVLRRGLCFGLSLTTLLRALPLSRRRDDTRQYTKANTTPAWMMKTAK